MRRAALAASAALALLSLAAAPAQAGHDGGPVPDGAMTVYVLFSQVDTYAPAPVSAVDGMWTQACAATTGQAISCVYTPRTCTPTDLAILCQT